METPKRCCLFVWFCARSTKRRQDRLIWLIETLSGSEMCHVAVGWNGVTYDPRIEGDFYHSTLWFAEKYPGIVGFYQLEVLADSLPFPQTLDRQPKPAIATFIRWLTRGHWPQTRDCVAVASTMIRAAGHPVPRNVVTPYQLWKWLHDQGFQYEAV